MPVIVRKALNIKAGDEVVVRMENDSNRLIPLQQVINMAQKAVIQYAPQGVSLVDDLIMVR